VFSFSCLAPERLIPRVFYLIEDSELPSLVFTWTRLT
jgi:hypothetical protein